VWYEFLACFWAGFLAGALVMAAVAAGKCSDCETTAGQVDDHFYAELRRVWRDGK